MIGYSTMIGYIAKDKNGELYLYSDKPIRHKFNRMWINSGAGDFLCLDNTEFKERFKNITFEDEPIQVHISITNIIKHD